MTRVALALLLAGLIGCTGIRPAGPLANKGGPPGAAKDDSPPPPVVVPSPKPIPPLNYVDPADVSADPLGAQQKLMSELEGDRKTIPAAPRTAEVSHLKNGVRQN